MPREYGNVHQESPGTKFFWIIVGLLASAGLAEAAWLGSAVVDLKAQVAALNAKVDFLIADRKPLYRGENHGSP